MSKSMLWTIVASIALAASIGMYQQGENNPNLSELKNFWYIPLPFAFIAFQIGQKHRQIAGQKPEQEAVAQEEASPEESADGS